jgi:hypothetical protein
MFKSDRLKKCCYYVRWKRLYWFIFDIFICKYNIIVVVILVGGFEMVK